MFESDKRSPLDRVKKSLYSRGGETPETPRHDIHAQDSRGVKTQWATEVTASSTVDAPEAVQSDAMNIMPRQDKPHKKGYGLILAACAAFFLVAVAIAGFTLFSGNNFVSVDNVDILVEGPVSVAGGEPMSLTAAVVNKNAEEIELVDLIAEFPDGTKDPSDPSKDLSRVRLSLGNIKPGQVVQRPLSAVMFGQEGDEREVKFTVEYRTANSNAIFYKDKPYVLTISSSPVIVSIDALDKVIAGQPTDVSVTVSSNSATPVRDLLLSLDYPSGFEVTPGEAKPAFGNNVWRIGDLAPGAKRTISFKAVIQGEDGEERVMHAHVGIRDQANEREIATTIVSRDRAFAVERPSLGVDLIFNGERTTDLVTEPGATVRADIVWTNNSSTRIDGARIVAKLSGNALDRNSISASGGYYNSSSDTIEWEAGRVEGLASIAPGDSNRVSFSFASRRPVAGQASVANPTVTVSVSAQGDRTDELGVSREVSTAVARSVKLVSSLGISARALYSQGAFINSGPIPPKVGEQTTYTLVWTVSNTSNNVSGTQVTGALPQGVEWLGRWSPSDANLSYNSVGGQVTWLVGDLQANGGSKQVSFQVGLTPSLTQAGSAAELMGQTVVTGTDSFAGATVRSSASALTTRTTTDLYWKAGDEIVNE